MQLKDSKKVVSCSQGPVDFPGGASNFKSSLAQWAKVEACHLLTKSLTIKMSKKWPQESKIGELLAKRASWNSSYSEP